METFPKKFKAKKWIALVIGTSKDPKFVDDQLTPDFTELPYNDESTQEIPKAPYVDHVAMYPGQEFEMGKDCGDCAYYNGIISEVFLNELEGLLAEDAIEIIEQ